MLEALILSSVGWLLLAATTHRFRRDARLGGTDRTRMRAAARILGIVAILGGAACCGAALPGERIVRFLAIATIAGTATILLLSIAASRLLPLVGALLALPRLGHSHAARAHRAAWFKSRR